LHRPLGRHGYDLRESVILHVLMHQTKSFSIEFEWARLDIRQLIRDQFTTARSCRDCRCTHRSNPGRPRRRRRARRSRYGPGYRVSTAWTRHGGARAVRAQDVVHLPPGERDEGGGRHCRRRRLPRQRRQSRGT
jgi:hypothetical protein